MLSFAGLGGSDFLCISIWDCNISRLPGGGSSDHVWDIGISMNQVSILGTVRFRGLQL